MHVLERALRILTAYRLFTLSHLRHHLEADTSFQAALTAASWSRTDLWDALGRTSLCDQSATELWQEIEPSIRRTGRLGSRFHRSTFSIAPGGQAAE